MNTLGPPSTLLYARLRAQGWTRPGNGWISVVMVWVSGIGVVEPHLLGVEISRRRYNNTVEQARDLEMEDVYQVEPLLSTWTVFDPCRKIFEGCERHAAELLIEELKIAELSREGWAANNGERPFRFLIKEFLLIDFSVEQFMPFPLPQILVAEVYTSRTFGLGRHPTILLMPL